MRRLVALVLLAVVVVCASAQSAPPRKFEAPHISQGLDRKGNLVIVSSVLMSRMQPTKIWTYVKIYDNHKMESVPALITDINGRVVTAGRRCYVKVKLVIKAKQYKRLRLAWPGQFTVLAEYFLTDVDSDIDVYQDSNEVRLRKNPGSYRSKFSPSC